MELKAPSASKLSLYVIYALVLTSVLLYVRFPAEKFEKFLEQKLEATFPGTDVKLGKFQIKFPSTILLDDLQVRKASGDDLVVELTNIRILPDWAGMGLRYTIYGNIYGGTVTAQIVVSPVAGLVNLDELEFSGVKLEQFEYLQLYSRRNISGTLDFVGAYSSSWKESGAGEGQGVLGIKNGTLALKRPVLALKDMDMQSLEVGLSLTGESLEMVEGVFTGKEVQAEFAGRVNLSDQNTGMGLDVSGSLEPQKAYLKEKPQVLRVVKRLQKQYRKTALPFKLTGSVGNPSFRFGN